MSSRPQTPHGDVPAPSAAHASRGYGSNVDLHAGNTGVTDFARDSRPSTAQGGSHTNQQGPAASNADVNRSASTASTAVGRDRAASRSNTLKKRSSLSRKTSLKRSGSRKSLNAGSIKGTSAGDATEDREYHSAYYTPIPTQGTPTDVLANRFQAWRNFLKSLITYFREVQTSYETRSKAIMKVSNVISNTSSPSIFISDGGLADATRILNDYHKHALVESNKAKDIEEDVIQGLQGLRADLAAKIKEIKGLHGDFKNSVEKEKEGTKRAIAALDDAIQHYDHTDGEKSQNDPFIVRLGVDRMIERQIDEENYLHRAYLNLESSGRELESIVVGEIQKAYNAIAGILRREGDDAYDAVEKLRSGPITMQKDLEWNQFVTTDPHFVNPDLPIRRVQDIDYPGKFHPAAAEIRAGMLERKSKYLKSYTPGWYVLSPTHLHEFKSADNIYSQPPVMSLHLAEQKLGSHSSSDSASHKFMLKGRQSGGVHRGHSWVFRAESYDTMMAWFDAIKNLTEKTGAERSAFVRQHARSVSAGSQRAHSISSDGLEEDEADHVPYAASISSQQVTQPAEEPRLLRPQPGGRFPSDLAVPRQRAISPSDNSSEPDNETIAAAAAIPASGLKESRNAQQTPNPTSNARYETNPYELQGVATHVEEPHQKERAAESAPMSVAQEQPSYPDTYEQHGGTRIPAQSAGHDQYGGTQTFSSQPGDRSGGYEASPLARDDYPSPPVSNPPQQNAVPTQTFVLPVQQQAPVRQTQPKETPRAVSPGYQSASGLSDGQPLVEPRPEQHRASTNYGDWMTPVAATTAGVGAGALGERAYEAHKEPQQQAPKQDTIQSPWPDATLTEHQSLTEEPSSRSAQYGAVPTSAQSIHDVSRSNGNVDDSTLSGQEAAGAHETGRLFPIIRHNTDMSVSNLHVPGEFPKSSPSASTTAVNGPSSAVHGSEWDKARE